MMSDLQGLITESTSVTFQHIFTPLFPTRSPAAVADKRKWFRVIRFCTTGFGSPNTEERKINHLRYLDFIGANSIIWITSDYVKLELSQEMSVFLCFSHKHTISAIAFALRFISLSSKLDHTANECELCWTFKFGYRHFKWSESKAFLAKWSHLGKLWLVSTELSLRARHC